MVHITQSQLLRALTLAGAPVSLTSTAVGSHNALDVDIQDWPVLTSTGTISGNGQNVTGPISGHLGASINVSAAAAGQTGTMLFEASFDNQVSWVLIQVFHQGGSGTAGIWIGAQNTWAASPNSEVFLCGSLAGATHVRIRAISFSGANLNVTINATATFIDTAHKASSLTEVAQPLGSINQITVGGNDGANSRYLRILNSLPVGTEYGALVRLVDPKTTEWGRAASPTVGSASANNAAPGIGAVQADSGSLAAGDYEVDIFLSVSDTNAVGKGLVVEHRDAANAVTLRNIGGCAVPGQTPIHLKRWTLALNERIRVIAGSAAGAAASQYVSTIIWRLAG